MSSPSENAAEAQREVQRKLGRNLLRIQQLEILMKALVAESVIEGQSGELHEQQDKRKQEVARKTLGQVAGDLTSGYLSPPALKEDQHEDHPGDPTKIWMRTSFRIEMSREDHLRTQQKLAELIELRNDLVHHFIENHDIWTLDGCARADEYLDDCFRLIDERFEELRNLAQHHLEAKNHIARFIQSDDFRDFIKHGILPGGVGVIWVSSTIVNLLRDAERALAEDGWTSLTKAIDYITGCEPAHTPRRYGCSSWRQVLHESALFTIRRERFELGTPAITWYRSRQV